MYEENNNGPKSFLLGVLAGGLIGGLVGLLFAPKSGRELRQDISDRSKEVWDDTSEYVTSTYSSASESVGHIIDDAKAQGERLLTDVEDLVVKAKDEASGFVGKELERIKSSVEAMVTTYKRINVEELVDEAVHGKIPRKIKKTLKKGTDLDETKELAESVIKRSRA